MITLTPVTAQNVLIFKEVRLRALQDTPSAFGSTYAREAAFSDADWDERAAQWTGESSITYLALDADSPCGIVAGFLNRDDASKVHLVSMWVAGSQRRQGVGRLLVDAIISWANSRSARILYLHVTSNNQSATAFYQSLGFAMTGHSEPHPNEPDLILAEMSYSLANTTDESLSQ